MKTQYFTLAVAAATLVIVYLLYRSTKPAPANPLVTSQSQVNPGTAGN